MRTPARLFGHPIHQMLIVFPLGLLPTATAFDLLYFATGNPRWADVAFWMLSCGIVGALAAAVFGVIDWSSIPRGTRAQRIGIFHGVGNVVVAALFAASWMLRDATAVPAAALLCSLLGVGLALVTAWLGGELVVRLGVGIDDDANLNAPSSLGTGMTARRPSREELPPHDFGNEWPGTIGR